MDLGRFSIRTRLAAGFSLMLALLVAVAALSLQRLSQFNAGVEQIVQVEVIKMVTGAQAGENILRAANHTGNVFVLEDPAHVRQELAALRSSRDLVNDILESIGRNIGDAREQELFGAVQSARAAYLPHEDEFLAAAENGDFPAARRAMLERARPAQLKYVEAVRHLTVHQVTRVDELANRASAAYLLTRDWILALGATATLLGVLLSWLLTRSITRPLAAAVAMARRVAAGDLSVRAQPAGKDEAAQLLRALTSMAEDLRSLVGEVQAGARTVSQASAHLALGHADLSERTEQQAAALEQTASSMEELTSTVAQNADSARRARDLAADASAIAQDGGRAMIEVVSTMTEISAFSRQVQEIIGIIDGIAFQTNLLALNAAVEAARAGTHGRGFAVVAAEVRTLAQRSAAAAREIKKLIGSSVRKVDAGAQRVNDAGQTTGKVGVSVAQVNDLIADIAAASEQQSSGIGQVNAALAQMDRVVQQNALLVEQAVASTQAMEAQATALLRLVSRFRLDAAPPLLAEVREELLPVFDAGPPTRRPCLKPHANVGLTTTK